jgi:hypothetical protein
MFCHKVCGSANLVEIPVPLWTTYHHKGKGKIRHSTTKILVFGSNSQA